MKNSIDREYLKNLTVLSRIIHSTKGEMVLRDRGDSLLEVGTVFHLELAGRENINFNDSILSMKKRKFVEIKQFLDTPVKRYSNGMYMHLKIVYLLLQRKIFFII